MVPSERTARYIQNQARCLPSRNCIQSLGGGGIGSLCDPGGPQKDDGPYQPLADLTRIEVHRSPGGRATRRSQYRFSPAGGKGLTRLDLTGIAARGKVAALRRPEDH